jgi:hypothetical protein
MVPNTLDIISVKLNDLPKGDIYCKNSTKNENKIIRINIFL